LALRIRSRWHEDGTARTAKEVAGLLAANNWKIATEKAVNLHTRGFVYRDDVQRLGAISEFLIFQAMVIDRIIYPQMETAQRGELITELVLKMADHVVENSLNMLGEGNYHAPFVETFNNRASEYAECQFETDKLNYPFMRCFGAQIQGIMGDDADNRWVIDQVMDVDAPEICKMIQRNLRQVDLASLSSSSQE